MDWVNEHGLLGSGRQKTCGTPTCKYQHPCRVLRRGPIRIARSCHLFRAAQPSGTPDELIASTGSPLSTLLRLRLLTKTPGQRMAVPEVPAVQRSTESNANRQQAISTGSPLPLDPR